MPARAEPQRGCVGRHLANRNEMSVSGSDSYALLLLFTLITNKMGESRETDDEMWSIMSTF